MLLWLRPEAAFGEWLRSPDSAKTRGDQHQADSGEQQFDAEKQADDKWS